MQKKKIYLVSLDFEKNNKIETFIQDHLSDEIEAIALIDENILNTVSDLFMEKGWLGAGQAENIRELFLKKAEREAQEWLVYIQKITKEKNKKIKTRIVKQFIEVFFKNLKTEETGQVIFVFKSGKNTTYDAVKNFLKNISQHQVFNYLFLK